MASILSTKILGFSAAILLTACSGVQYQNPEVSKEDQQVALAEIEAFSPSNTTASMSESVAARRLQDVYVKIYPAAMEVCRSVGENRFCAWEISYSDLEEYNAFATDGNRVVVFHGIISATDNDDELAFVLAHELGHHIADHIGDTRKRANTGILITGLSVAALSRGAGGCNTYTCMNNLKNAAQLSMQAGGTVGAMMFSVDQEKEADYLAARILSLSGYDLDKSRTMMVKLGAKDDDKETGFLDSHPAGPERLASYDKMIEVIQSESDDAGGKENPEEEIELRISNSRVENSDPDKMDVEAKKFDPKNCRLYVPEDNICIF